MRPFPVFSRCSDSTRRRRKQDIEGIEHHLSADTVQILADLACFFEKNPETLKQFLKSRKPLKQ